MMAPSFENVLQFVDILGVIVFALSGALVASRKQMDIIGFVLMASLTGVGGGTLRDLLLGRQVFWIVDPLPVWGCLIVAVIVFFAAHVFHRRYTIVLWADGMGIAIYAVMGAELARQFGSWPLVSVMMGVMTATFGGLLRDVICNETPLILRPEIYATCVAAGAVTHILLVAGDVPVGLAAATGIFVTFGLRAAGIIRGVTLPGYKARPGRDY
jgi:uncharacterized membrane protein YeiH